MTTLLFSLVFTYSGVSYTLATDLSIHTCSGRRAFEREAIKQVQQQFPKLIMTVTCQPQ